MPFDALKKLHTAMLDTREGYQVAEREGETPELKSLFRGLIQLREKDHEAIHQVLTSHGSIPMIADHSWRRFTRRRPP